MLWGEENPREEQQLHHHFVFVFFLFDHCPFGGGVLGLVVVVGVVVVVVVIEVIGDGVVVGVVGNVVDIVVVVGRDSIALGFEWWGLELWTFGLELGRQGEGKEQGR